jgi:hypothetical protein
MATRVIIEVTGGVVTNVYSNEKELSYIVVDNDTDSGTEIGDEMQQDDISNLGDGTIEGALAFYRLGKAFDDYERWEVKYRPMDNTLASEERPYNNKMFETFGAEEEHIFSMAEEHVWTLIEAEGKMYLRNGRWQIDRQGYFWCQKPWEGGCGAIEIMVADSTDDEEDEDAPDCKYCNGTGQGAIPDIACSYCQGSGVEGHVSWLQ